MPTRLHTSEALAPPLVWAALLGSLCARVQGSSPAHPARVEVRIVIPR